MLGFPKHSNHARGGRCLPRDYMERQNPEDLPPVTMYKAALNVVKVSLMRPAFMGDPVGFCKGISIWSRRTTGGKDGFPRANSSVAQ